MVVTLCWAALAVAALGWEVRCRRPGSPWNSLAQLVSEAWSRPVGRIALLVLWSFVGWHLFARYTVPDERMSR